MFFWQIVPLSKGQFHEKFSKLLYGPNGRGASLTLRLQRRLGSVPYSYKSLISCQLHQKRKISGIL